MTEQTIDWLRGLATAGGKGVVNNIDARCLGRIADELERLGRRVVVLEMVIGEELYPAFCHDDANAMIVEDILAKIARSTAPQVTHPVSTPSGGE